MLIEENNGFIKFGRMFITLGSRLLLVGIGCAIVGIIITL